MSVTATVGQIAIDPKMPRIKHLINRLDCRSNLVSHWEVSLAMGPSFQGCWRSTGNHGLHRDQRIKRDSFLFFKRNRGIKTSIQFAIYTECKVLLNCKFPMVITKGRGTQACIKYE